MYSSRLREMDGIRCFVWILIILQVTTAADRRDQNSRYTNSQEVINSLFETGRYSKSDPPSTDKSTEVKLGIYVNSLYSINEQTMDYAVSMYLRQSWQDKRLKFQPIDNKIHKIRLTEDSMKKIWVPDTFIRNEKRATFHDVTVENRLMTLNSSGFLWYVLKISATLSCPMKLHKYPMDIQHCPMKFESYGYTMDTMSFSWLPRPVDTDPDIELPQFMLEDTILYNCSQIYTSGSFPCLEIQFVLRREVGFHVLQIYIPTMLIVALSWVAFWIDIEATLARVFVGLLTVMAITTQSTNANSSLPKVSYVKAIDIWFLLCLMFVFAGLLEFVVANMLNRKQGKSKQTNAIEKETGGTESSGAAKGADPENKNIAQKIDKISRFGFPVAFLIFIIIYFIIYKAQALMAK